MASVKVFFSSDKQVAASVGRTDAKQCAVSQKSKHVALAQELCSNPNASNTVKHLVECDTISIGKKALLQLIDDMRDETLETKKKQSSPAYTVVLAAPSTDCKTSVNASIVKYTLPIAYNIVGLLNDSAAPMFAVRLVWEKHSAAMLKGQICTDAAGNYTQRDSSIKHALARLGADAKPTYPLPIADFFCQCAMAERAGKSLADSGSEQKCVDGLAPELRALLLVTEVDVSSLSF